MKLLRKRYYSLSLFRIHTKRVTILFKKSGYALIKGERRADIIK